MAYKHTILLILSCLIFASADCERGCEICDSGANVCLSCGEGWIAADCSEWIGTCNDLCFSCDGPDLEDCIYCTDHASKNWDNPSVC